MSSSLLLACCCCGRLRLPKGTAGRDYVLIQLRVRGKGPVDFMVDSGLTAELITPHLRQQVCMVKGVGPPRSPQVQHCLPAGSCIAVLLYVP